MTKKKKDPSESNPPPADQPSAHPPPSYSGGVGVPAAPPAKKTSVKEPSEQLQPTQRTPAVTDKVDWKNKQKKIDLGEEATDITRTPSKTQRRRYAERCSPGDACL